MMVRGLSKTVSLKLRYSKEWSPRGHSILINLETETIIQGAEVVEISAAGHWRQLYLISTMFIEKLNS